MGIQAELDALKDELAKRDGYQGHLERIESKHWEGMYWKVCSQMTELQKNLSEKIEAFTHEVFRARDLQELNYTQATRIMELEFFLSFISFTGDTIRIDYQKMQQLSHFIKQSDRHEPKGLSSSKYMRKK